jgi:uncharacterized membrane protein
MAVLGLPGGGELIVILVVLFIGVAIPGWSMYRVASRVGYSGGALTGWTAAGVFFGYLALLALSLMTWPRDGQSG